VADKMKAFIGNLGLWVRKLEGKRLDMLSCLKDFVEENSVETSDTGIYQTIKYHLVNIQPRFYKYFQKQHVTNTNVSRFYSMQIRPKITTFLLQNKKTVLTLYLILL
jgi:hypothetical protein